MRAGLAAVYTQLNTASTGNYRYLKQIPADDEVIPVRGQDWFDNGAHLEAQRHTWQAGSPLALGTINSAWTQNFTGVARANVLLEAIQDLPLANKPRTIAEVRVLRAYFYYNLMDLFGGLPIVTDAAVTPRERDTRAATFAFIEKELTEARTDLPVALACRGLRTGDQGVGGRDAREPLRERRGVHRHRDGEPVCRRDSRSGRRRSTRPIACCRTPAIG